MASSSASEEPTPIAVTNEGIPVAVFYTKLKNRLLAPFARSGSISAPLEIRRALPVIDHGIHGYVERAGLGTAAQHLSQDPEI
jgi:hypothetical protein